MENIYERLRSSLVVLSLTDHIYLEFNAVTLLQSDSLMPSQTSKLITLGGQWTTAKCVLVIDICATDFSANTHRSQTIKEIAKGDPSIHPDHFSPYPNIQ